jgi:exodeoxyribonuclease VII small subunit
MTELPTFEKAIARLETIVETLEKGEIALEQALELYQEGQVLLKSCQGKLSEAEKKLKILAKDGSGEFFLKDADSPNDDVDKE